mmetsp:Transcript_61313/g.159246  ORF Transcript_61313/g.159246 Transcript_61313/m.159246 type:complete len:278 (+) Transcript_61313:1216-2049(+)
MPAECAPPSYMSHAASPESSKKVVPGSMIAWMRSRGSALPRLLCWSTALSPPPACTSARRRFSSATRPPWIASFLAKVSSRRTGGRRRLEADGPAQGRTPSPGPYHTAIGSTPPCCLATMWRCRSASLASCAAMAAAPASSTMASITTRSWPERTVSSATMHTFFTMPSAGAWISVSSFMAERRTSTSPRCTSAPSGATTWTTVASIGAFTTISSLRVALPAAAAFEGGAGGEAAAAALRAAPWRAMKERRTSLFTNSGCIRMFRCKLLFVFTPWMS